MTATHAAPTERDQARDRDVLASLIRRFQGLDPDTIADPSAALDIFVAHLAPVVADELERRRESLLDRLRPLTPNGERVLGAAVAVLAFLLFLASLVLIVKQVTS